MRGKVFTFRPLTPVGRITPAYAGKRKMLKTPAAGTWDHPRVCGEKHAAACADCTLLGSPPRMRGKAFKLNICLFHLGITPAYAGKSRTSGTGGSGRRDHPRVCGEKAGRCPGLFRATGSPPRMRGKAYDEEHVPYGERITPAYAGKSTIISHRAYLRRDHPRVCGEKRTLARCRRFVLGSPPRMRGKGDRTKRPHYHGRITPAYAGKSDSTATNWLNTEDHPRVCGEKSHHG